MSKFHLNSVSSKLKPNKRKVVLVLSGLFILALVVVSLAAYQVNAHNKAVAHDQAIQANTALLHSKDAQIAQLEAQVTSLQADKVAACSNYKALSTARGTRGLVTTPTAVHCQ